MRTWHRHSAARVLAGALAAALIAVGGSAALASPAREVHRFYGYAFNEKTGKFLYTEVHQHLYDGDRWLGGTIRYFDPDNQLIAEKTLDFAHDPYIPQFRLRIPAEHYEEAITEVTPASIDMEKLFEGKREHDHLAHAAGLVADSGFHSYIVDHLPELDSGKTLSFSLAVAGRLSSYRFRLRKTGNGSADGHPTIKLLAEPDSLLRLVAPSLSMAYDLQTHYLVEYRGISNIHDPATQQAYPSVRITYPGKPPSGAPAQLPPLDAN